MQKHIRNLSAPDQKAIDVLLDHSASAVTTDFTRVATPVEQQRLNAATRLLSLLSELPEIDPPADLVAKTMDRIDSHLTGPMEKQPAPVIHPRPQVH
jgi:hypothetical protein